MRLRIPITVLFLLACIASAYLGLSRKFSLSGNRDKLLHVIVFFVLTILFYWSIDAPRKRAVNLTLGVCCLVSTVGSEFLQSFLTHGERAFDVKDIAANVVGSIFATVLSSWYHGRLNRRRKQARYDRMRQDVEGDQEPEELEMGPVTDDSPEEP